MLFVSYRVLHSRARVKSMYVLHISRRVGIIIVSAVFAFLLVVGIDQAMGYSLNRYGYFKAMTPNLTEIHDTSEFMMIATISAQGIRNQPVTVPKPEGVTRIMALGDSFTYGDGVALEESWPKRLEASLSAAGKKIEVINVGKPGVGITYERQICKAYRDQFDTDMIILAMYTDDISQAGARILELRDDPFEWFGVSFFPTLARIGRSTIGFSRWEGVRPGDRVVLSEHAKQKVAEMIDKTPQILLNVHPSLRSDFVAGKINPSLITGAQANPKFFTYYFDSPSVTFALSALGDRFTKFKNRCSRDLPTYVILVPSSELVSEHYFRGKQILGYTMDSRLTTFDLDSLIRPVVERFGFGYLSPLAAFRRDGCPGCYYEIDGHFTAEGQRRFAEFVYEKIGEGMGK